ncbi:MAG: IPT/TIG domain-containing protein, partial [Bacteroidota bacterium]
NAQCTYATQEPVAVQTPPSDGTLYGPIASGTARYFQASVDAGTEYIVYDVYADFLTVWGTSNGTGLLGTGTQYVFFTTTGTSVWIDFAASVACPANYFTLNAYITAVPQPTGIPSGVVCIGQTITITGTALAGSGGAGDIGFTGGVTATAFNVTATSLDVVIPAGAQTGPITVSNSLVIATTAASLDIRTAFGVSSLPTAGGVGDNIVISGNNLVGATNVRVNGTLATNVVVTSTKITCTVAPGTVGVGNVTFTDGCGNAVTASAFTVVALTNYYSKALGNLNVTGTWGQNPDGSGATPANFTTQGQRFNIRNNPAPTIAANWTVSGLGSGVNVGDGTNPCDFTVPSLRTFAGTVISINANATLTINRSTLPTLTICICDPTSTVVFSVNANITIPGIIYGNLTISGAYARTYTFSGNSTIVGTFTISTIGTVRMNNTTTPRTFNVNNFIMSAGTFDGGSVDPSSGNYTSITNFTGNFNKSAGTITNNSPSSLNSFIFNGGASQTFSNSGTYLYNVTRITNNTTLVLNSNCTQNGVTGTPFYVDAGSILDCGTYQLSTTANPVTFDIKGTLITANVNGLSGTATTTLSSANSPAFSLGTISTIEYNSTLAQAVTARSDYANITFSNNSTKTAGGTFTASRNLTINTTATFAAGNYTHNIGGNWVNDGTFTASTGTINFDGSAIQTISGSSETTFNNLQINNSASVNLGVNTSVNTALQMSLGYFDLKDYQVTLGSSASITGGETETRRIRSTDGLGIEGNGTGTITTTRNDPSGNVANLGLDFTPAAKAALGSTVIIRGHQSLQGSGTYTGNYGINRYYEIQPTVQSDVIINSFNYFDAELGAQSANEANLEMFQWIQTGVAQYWTPCTTTGSSTVTNYVASSTSTNSLLTYKITLGSTISPLPIELLSFEAICKDGSNNLIWKTASEHNNDYFTLEKSFDGENFIIISQVPSQGNSNSIQNYSEIDNIPFNGTNYYRLKQTDTDGQYTYSNIISLNCLTDNHDENIIPVSPSDGKVDVFLQGIPGKKYQIELTNILGQVIINKEITLTDYQQKICISDSYLAKGIYYLIMQTENNKISKPVIIN